MVQLHASCVAFGSQGILIRGASGSGKSTLALALMSLGATLVSDDRTDVAGREDGPIATPPDSIRGLIEARGVGLLQAETKANARIALVVDLDQTETARLPDDRATDIAGHSVPLLHKVESPHFAAMLRQYVMGGKATR